MLQRLLDTVSLTGKQWGVVLLLSLIAPGIVWVDKTIQLARLRKREAEQPRRGERWRLRTDIGPPGLDLEGDYPRSWSDMGWPTPAVRRQ